MKAIFSALWRLVERYIKTGAQVVDSCHHDHDSLLWHKDMRKLYKSGMVGDFSLAVVQANANLEDQCQVKVGPHGTLIGIYDGHGGAEAARFIASRLFPKIELYARESGGISLKVLRQALSTMEEEFLSFVQKLWRTKPQMISVGSCCLVGAIRGNTLLVANVGDSRVVLGTEKQGKVVALRLIEEHNASNVEVRRELKAKHPDDSNIVTMKQGVWRVKGIIQVSRSIGDVYLKSPDFGRDPLLSSAGVTVSFQKPVLSAEPSLHERTLCPEDRFLIFASDGLWDLMTDQEVVDIVQKGPRKGIARKLVTDALKRAANKISLHYSDLKQIKPGARRQIHDDISVVVVYLGDHKHASRSSSNDRVYVNAPLDIFSPDNLENMPLI